MQAEKHLTIKYLRRYLVGDLRRDDFFEVDNHLDSCGDCLAELIGMAALVLGRNDSSQPNGDSERRQDRRIITQDFGFARVLTQGWGFRMIVRVQDVSKNGIRFLAPAPLPMNHAIQVRVRDSVILGQLRHCTPADDGLTSCGVKIEEANLLPPAPGPEQHVTGLLGDYVFGVLDGEASRAATDHICRCHLCRDELTDLCARLLNAGACGSFQDVLNVHDHALVRVLAPFSAQETEAGLTQVSDKGVVFFTETPILPGATVQLSFRHVLAVAVVRSSAERGKTSEMGAWILRAIPRAA